MNIFSCDEQLQEFSALVWQIIFQHHFFRVLSAIFSLHEFLGLSATTFSCTRQCYVNEYRIIIIHYDLSSINH